MLRWTNNYPMPSIMYEGEQNVDVCVYTTTVEKCLWMADEHGFNDEDVQRETMNLKVLDSEAKTCTRVECEYKGEIPKQVFSIGSHKNDIFMLLALNDTDFEYGDVTDVRNARLYRLNTKTFVWEEFMKLNCGGKSLIVGDQMYFFGSSLTIVDLNTKQVKVHDVYLEEDDEQNYGSDQEMVEINGKVYIIEHSSTHRNVTLFQDGNFVQLSNDEYKTEEQNWDRTMNGLSGSVLYTTTDRIDPYHYLDTFDPTKCRWDRKLVEKCWQSSMGRTAIKSGGEIDGKIYAVMPESKSKYSKFEIRVLDTKPDLTTICCLDVIEDSQKNPKIARKLKKRLPINIRKRVTKMMEWREKEKNHLKRVNRKRKRHINKQREIEAMRKYGLMEPEESYRLQLRCLYDSDSGSDFVNQDWHVQDGQSAAKSVELRKEIGMILLDEKK